MNHCAGKNTCLGSTVRFHEHYLSLSKLNSLSQWKAYIPCSLHYSIHTYYRELFPGEMPNQTFYIKQTFVTNEHSELYTKNNTIVTPIHYLSSQVSSRYLIYISSRCYYLCMTTPIRNCLLHLQAYIA
jgi:hypothetical protein